MRNISLTSLKMPFKEEWIEVKVGEKAFKAKKTIPQLDIFDAVEIALQASVEGNQLSRMVFDTCFIVNLFFVATNVEPPEKLKADYFALYDNIVYTGIWDRFVEAYGEDRIKPIFDCAAREFENAMKYDISVKSLMDSIMNEYPERAEQAEKVISNFDKEKFTEITGLAKNLNMPDPNKPES